MSVEVKIPAGRTPIQIRTNVSAKWVQKVTIKPDSPNPYLYEWAGQGEDGTIIGSTQESRTKARVFTVTAEHSEDGGKTWKPNQIKMSTVKTASFPPITVTTVSTEDGGDEDFDDSVTHFIY
eukprot:Phypoly_transcript_28664.p2 GENE.Phypoly_transcript_28664~~Phypoly_transcript_28664.p2  ORF type:complete len:122 (+),score=20.13 Phypoly_transcript_28664:66-431(+)